MMRTRRFLAFALAVIMLFSSTITASATSSATISGNDIVEVTDEEGVIDTIPSDEVEELSEEEIVESDVEEGDTTDLLAPVESEESTTEEITSQEMTTEEVTEELTSEEESETAEELEQVSLMNDVEEYIGDVHTYTDSDGEHIHLSLYPCNVGKNSYTVEELTAILSANYEKGAFNHITLDYMDPEQKIIYKDIVAALLPYLYTGENTITESITISFSDSETGNYEYWNLYGPQEQDEDITVSGGISIKEGDVYVQASGQDLKADWVEACFRTSKSGDPQLAGSITDILGETESYRNYTLEGTDVSVYYSNRDEDNTIFIDVDNIKNLSSDTTYKLVEYAYNGNISVWGDGRKELSIRYGEGSRDRVAFTEEELLNILDNYSTDDELYCIYIEQPASDADMIYKSVADKAAELLDNGVIKFAFRDTTAGNTIEWQLEGISAGVVQTADQTLKASFSLSEDNMLVFNRDSFELNVDPLGCVSVGYFINPESDLAGNIFTALGDKEGNRRIEIADTDSFGQMNYSKADNNLWLYLNGINALEANKDYQIANHVYRGNITYDRDELNNVIGTGLWLSALELGQNSIDLVKLNEIVDYWVNTKEMQFDRVAIEQKYTSNNIIKKDLINALLPLLSNPSEQQIEFVFCNCYDDENNGRMQNDMNWTLFGPKTATKDINANVTVTGKGGAGVSVVLKANTYPAENVSVNFWMHENSDMAQNQLIPAWGKPQQESKLVVLEKASTLNNDVRAYYTNGNTEDYASLHLERVEDWTAGIDNRLVEAYYRRDINVGQPVRLPLFSYDPDDTEDPGYPPEDENAEWNHPDLPKGDIKFKLLTPEYATLTDYDQLTATVPYKTVYTLCTYTSVSNKTCIEVLGYPTRAAVTGVAFEHETMDIEWCEGDDYNGFLKVNISPFTVQNYVSPQGFEWYVSGNSIALREYEWNYSFTDSETGEEISGTQMRPNGEFYVTGYGTTTVTVRCGEAFSVCTINVVEPVQVPEISSIYAIPAIDKTLADLGNLNDLISARCESEYSGTFTWKDDTISLAPYANMEYAEFGAIYTEKDGREVEVTVMVEMLRVTEIDLYSAWVMEYIDGEDGTGETVRELALEELNNTSVFKDDELVIGYQVGINRPQFDENGMTDAFATFARYIGEEKMIFRWKEELAELLADYENYDVYQNGQIQKPRLFGSDTKGKKTVTVQAVNLLTDEVIFQSSATIVVSGKPLFTFTEEFGFVDMVDAEDEMKGTYEFTIGADNYKNAGKLTFKSADTSVLKLGSAKVGEVIDGVITITVPYEFKKFGDTVLKVTAADEVKSTESFMVERVDYEPKLARTSFTIDKAWINPVVDNSCSTEYVEAVFHHDTDIAGEVTIKEEAYRDVFTIVGNSSFFIKANEPDKLKKNYTLTLVIPYTIGDSGDVHYSEQKIKIAVKTSKIKVTVKQTKKINEFYDLYSEESCGIFTVKTPYGIGAPLTINEDSVFDLEVLNSNDYDTFEYRLVLKEGNDIKTLSDAQKKITLEYVLNGTNNFMPRIHFGSVELKLKTEKKAPSLILTKKGDTLYPNMNVSGAGVSVINKATGEMLDLTDNVELVLNKNKNLTQKITAEYDSELAPYEYLTIGKNKYYVWNDGMNIHYWLYDSANAVKTSGDKLVLRIQKENWNGHVDLTYAAKVDLKVPKLKLGSKSLTINANDAIYKYQRAETSVNVTGYNGTFFDEIWVTGANAAATDALEKNLAFEWNRENSLIRFAVANKGNEEDDTLLSPGTYKFKVWTMVGERKISTDITLKVVDKPVAKAVGVTKKGSIDVLRRESTQITLKPKFTNLSGVLVDFRLTGADAQLFRSYYNPETGECIVKARPDVNYSTKISYNVIPVYVLNSDGDYEVSGKAQKIKVTQGKPKVSVVSSATTLYGDKGYGVMFAFDALLKSEDIQINNVELLNYTKDLDWYSQGNGEYMLNLNGNIPKDITKASGKYTLKFAVTYTDAAGNEKATQVSYKLNIVR